MCATRIMTTTETKYVLGHTDHERRRLALQASVLNPLTDSFLRRAGISAGMRVLELGCGIGEVSLMAARLVGPHGHMHCIDIDEDALEIARGRCLADFERALEALVRIRLAFPKVEAAVMVKAEG